MSLTDCRPTPTQVRSHSVRLRRGGGELQGSFRSQPSHLAQVGHGDRIERVLPPGAHGSRGGRCSSCAPRCRSPFSLSLSPPFLPDLPFSCPSLNSLSLVCPSLSLSLAADIHQARSSAQRRHAPRAQHRVERSTTSDCCFDGFAYFNLSGKVLKGCGSHVCRNACQGPVTV